MLYLADFFHRHAAKKKTGDRHTGSVSCSFIEGADYFLYFFLEAESLDL